MALPNTTVFEVRGTTGNNTNGGGFVAGGAGTDWSIAAGTPQYSVTDGVTAGTTTITSVTANFGTDVVDNIIYVAGGSGAVAAARYRIVSRTNATTIVVDRSTGLTAGTGVTLKIGGALATIQGALDCYAAAVGGVSDMLTYVKADGTYTISAALTTPALTAAQFRSRIIGYTTTRGDDGQVTVATSGAINALVLSSNGWGFENFVFSGGGSGLIGVNISTGNWERLKNVKVTGFTTDGVRLGLSLWAIFRDLEITACAGTAGLNVGFGYATLVGGYIHENTTAGISCGSNGTMSGIAVISALNTGASSDGVIISGAAGLTLHNSLFYGNGRDGVRGVQAYSFMVNASIMGCIFAKNAGYGLNLAAAAAVDDHPTIDYNGHWSNTLGPRNNVSLGAHSVDITGVDPTNDPFVDKANKDWRLNATAGAGALLRSLGFPGEIAGLPGVVGYEDIGPYRHQDPAGGGSGISMARVRTGM